MADDSDARTPRPPGFFDPGPSLSEWKSRGRETGGAGSPVPTVFLERLSPAASRLEPLSPTVSRLDRPAPYLHPSEQSDMSKAKVELGRASTRSQNPVAKEDPSRRVVAAVLGTSLGLAGLILALTVGLIAYIFANRAFFDRQMLYVKVPNNRILLVSSVISKVPPVVPQIMMGVAAVGFGSDWLGTSLGVMHRGEGLSNDLTPEQYALLLRICSQAGPLSLVDAHAYYLRRFTRHKKLPHMPPILFRGIVYFTVLFVIVQVSGVLDTVLHDKIWASAFAQLSEPYDKPRNLFGRQLNQTLCASTLNSRVGAPQCASVILSAQGVNLTEPYEGILTATNTSTVHEVVLVDEVALLMDRQRAQNTFTAKTIGYTTTCKPVSQQCGLFALIGTQAPFACPDYPLFVGNMADMESQAVLEVYNNSATTILEGSAPGSTIQPIQLGLRYSVQAYGGPLDSQVIRTIDNLPTLLLWCEANILAVTYHYQPYRAKPITIVDYGLADPNDTYVVSGPYIHSFGNEFYTPVVAANFVHNDSNVMAAAFAESLSYVAMALVAGMYEPALNLVDYPVSVTYNGSEVHVPTFALYLASLVAISFMCAWIGLKTNRTEYALGIRHDRSGKEISALQLAALRLSDPATLVHQLFSSTPPSTRGGPLSGLFDETESEARLHLGMVDGKFGVIPAQRRPTADGMVLA